MANISAIKLPSGTTYDIKDNSGEKSVHNHELASIVPITSKTYTSSSYYATSSGSWEAASWYFMSVKPDTWDKPWKIRIRVHSFCPGYSNVESYTDALITGRRDGVAYSNYTERLDTAHYYIPYYTLKKAGFDAGLGHAIGISILYGTGYTTAAYYRTFKVDFYESENCTVTFFDTPIKWSSWTNGNTTNYNSLGSLDAVTRGYTQSGDRNDVNYQNRIYYTYKKPYATLYRYQILLSRADGTLLPVNSVDNAPSNINKTLTIEEFDPFGEIYYYNSSTTRTTSQNLDNNVLYRQILADLRYSFNITNESGKCLTGSQSVYIVATPQSNGMAKLASPALVQALPSTEDGKIYIYIGQAYPDTYPYRTELPLYHPIYWYKNGAICQYVGNPYTVNGHTVNSDVPANANFTDTKVNMIARGTTKSYLLGTTTAPTSSNQAVSSVAETGVYFDTTAGTLVATTFKGALTGTASGNLTSSSTLSAAKLSGAIPSAVTATTQASTDNSTKIATTAYVTTAIANLPEPMIFKGSVGTGGTVTSLPTAAASNEGWTYKVITALSSPAAKVGDTVISNGSSWVVIPSGDEPSGTVTSVGVSNGGGLSVSGSPVTSSGTITVSHADTSSQASSSNSGRTYIQSITLDTYGHVTGLSTATETVTNTDTKLKVAEVTSATQYYPLVGTGTTAAERQYDTTGLKYKGTTGTTSAVGSAILELGNSTASGTAGNKQAQLIMYGTNAKKATITLAAPSADIALALPTSGGTLALASQIPTVPSSTGSATTGITASTAATKTTLGTAFTIPNVTSAGSASTWAFEEITIPNVTSAGSASTWTFEEKTIPNVTSAGSASTWAFTSKTVVTGVTFAMDTTDTKKLKITTSTDTVYSKSSGGNGTAPTLGTAIKVQSKSGGGNGTAPTLGTAIKVQSKKSGANGSAPTLGTAFTVPNVTGNTSATVTIVDNGHTHTI